MVLNEVFAWWTEQMRDLVPASLRSLAEPELAPAS